MLETAIFGTKWITNAIIRQNQGQETAILAQTVLKRRLIGSDFAVYLKLPTLGLNLRGERGREGETGRGERERRGPMTRQRLTE
eukprot:3842286-Rhodomonas_salina.1